MRKAICFAGVVCGRAIWLKPTSMRLACMRRMDGAARAGMEPIGIGTAGVALSLSFRAMGFSTARLAGGSILPGGSIRLRFSGTDMDTGYTDADTGTITITLVQTRVTWDPARLRKIRWRRISRWWRWVPWWRWRRVPWRRRWWGSRSVK